MGIEEHRGTRHLIVADWVILSAGLLIIAAGYVLDLYGFKSGGVMMIVGGQVIVVAVVFFLSRRFYIKPQQQQIERLRQIERRFETPSPLPLPAPQEGERQSTQEAGHETDTDEFSRKQQQIYEELSEFPKYTRTFDARTKLFLLNKIGQNILSLATTVKEEPETEVFANLMIFDEKRNKLKMILTRGFYYKASFYREFPITGTREEGSCGKAFRENKILIIDNVFADDRVHLILDRKYENMGSLINIPIARRGALNIDSPKLSFFTPHDDRRMRDRMEALQRLSERFLGLYLDVEKKKLTRPTSTETG